MYLAGLTTIIFYPIFFRYYEILQIAANYRLVDETPIILILPKLVFSCQKSAYQRIIACFSLLLLLGEASTSSPQF